MNRKKIGITGHRPNKLYGYNLNDKRWLKLKEEFKKELILYDCEEAYSGMALGVDMIFALAVLELKEEGYDIRLICCIPCINHTSAWFDKLTIDLYNNILNRADNVVIVTQKAYKPYLMQIRNEYIVNNIDFLFTVWNGTEGGTCNCINYALKKNKFVKNFIRRIK
jgi:uncharacterized phage-like protein YoqJ